MGRLPLIRGIRGSMSPAVCSRPVPGAQLPSTEICGNISGNISILFPKFSGFSHVHPFSIIHLEYLQLTSTYNICKSMGCFLVIGILMVLKIWVPQVTMSFNAIVLSDFGWVPPILGNPHITRDALRNMPKILRHNMGCNYDTSHSWGYTMDYTRHQT